MTETARFFEAISYTDDNFAQAMRDVAADGVVSGVLNSLAVAAGAGMNLTIDTGEAYCYGTWYQNDASKTLTCDAADPSNPRIDRVILRRTASSNTLVAAVLKGTAAGSPSAPSLTQTTAIWEISLAQIAIAAGATSLGAITDERTINIFGRGVPSNVIAYTTDSSAPSNWAEQTAVRGRVIVATPSGGTHAGTVGTALTNLLDRTHSHDYTTVIAHTHTVQIANSSGALQRISSQSSVGETTLSSVINSTGSASGTTTTATTSNTIPYIQYLCIKKS